MKSLVLKVEEIVRLQIPINPFLKVILLKNCIKINTIFVFLIMDFVGMAGTYPVVLKRGARAHTRALLFHLSSKTTIHGKMTL